MNQVTKIRSRFLILFSLFLATAANAGNILMIVDEEGMNAGDSAVKVLAEELGHTVTIATPPTTPSQADTMNLVLFSSSYHGDWDDGFRTMNIPVLSWDWYGYEIMAMAESGTLTSAPGESTVTIIDSTHIMAAGLTGTVQVDTCCSELDFAEPPSSAQIVATRTCSPWISSIWGFEAGAGMAYGYPAPARRVGTFIYENGPTLLTPEGKALIKAEITWAISPPDTGTSSPPVVVITDPSQDTTVSGASITVHFTVDGVPDSLSFGLSPGNNELIVSSTNVSGTGEDTVYVARGTTSSSDPTWPSGASLTASNIHASSMTLSWSAANDDSAVTHYQVYANNILVGRYPASRRTANIVGLLINTIYTFRVEALDLRENISIDGPVRNFSTSNSLPPNPATTATAIPNGEATIMSKSMAFLYASSNPIQTGIADSAIDPVRISVLRGTVHDISGDALSGVTVSIAGHPEIGSTVTRSSGEYDLVVNGGGKLTVQYSTADKLTIQRDIQTTWQEFEILPTVVMIEQDSISTKIRASDTAFQVARGSSVSDTSGSRRATLFIQPNTSVTLSFSRGSSINPDSIHIRATEYTVGPHGPEAMPATLPPTTGYTYAVEYSADEVSEMGAKSITFSKPIYSYLENFVGIPVGYPVPSAYYDLEQQKWIPTEDGRVIKISGISGGKANLIVDTSGSTATDSMLECMGISNSERANLASLYTVNETLWRVPVRHFSPHDYNMVRMAAYLDSLRNSIPLDSLETDLLLDETCNQSGSVIDCQNHGLGETLSIPGFPTLTYRGERTNAKRWNRLVVHVSKDTIPSNLSSIRLEIQIAGRYFDTTYTPAINIRKIFDWDGLDAYGRKLKGRQPYSYTISYGYNADYAPPPNLPYTTNCGSSLDSTTRSFGAVKGDSFSVAVPARTTFDVHVARKGLLGASEVEDLGPGWSVANHTSYSPNESKFYFGDGKNLGREGRTAIYTIGGKGNDSTGDARNLKFGAIQELDVAPDGSILIADKGLNKVWKIDRNKQSSVIFRGAMDDVKSSSDGKIYLTNGDLNSVWTLSENGDTTRFAGTGVAGYSGDGGIASEAKLDHPENIAIGPDGSVYIADKGNCRVRKVTPDGIIQTAIGTGSASYNGENTGARATNLGVNHIAVGTDGSVYICDSTNARVRKMDVKGVVKTIAGNGTEADAGEYVRATGTSIRSNRIEVYNAENGEVHILLADYNNGKLRMIDESGTIRTIGGGSDLGLYTYGQDGISPKLTPLDTLRGLSVDGNGNIVVGLSNHQNGKALVRYITDKFSDFTGNDILLPSPNGGEVSLFDSQGKQEKVLNTFTGKQLLEYNYTSSGLLSDITDAYGNITEIQRQTNGRPTAIVNSYGRTLTLATDDDGNLSQILLPSGDKHTFSYRADGLMDIYTTPRGKVHTFAYDSLGRLSQDSDPSGGYKTLSRHDSLGGWRTTVETAMGRNYQYDITINHNWYSEIIKTITDPAGLKTFMGRLNGSEQFEEYDPDKTDKIIGYAPEARFNMPEMRTLYKEVAIADNDTSGEDHLVLLGFNLQSQVLADPLNPMTLKTFLDTAVINEKIYLSFYSDSLKMWVRTSPEGRVDTLYTDSLGRSIEKITPGVASVLYDYDSHGRVGSVSQGTGPQERVTSFSYNLDGQISQIDDAEGRTVQFDYDLAGRVIKKTLADGREINLEYDSSGNIRSIAPPGLPSHQFEYNAMELDSNYMPPTIGMGPWNTSQAYNLDHQSLQIVRPTGDTIKYRYDFAGRVDSMLTSSGIYFFKYSPLHGYLDSAISPYGESLRILHRGPLIGALTWSGLVSGKVSFGYDIDFRVDSEMVNDSGVVEKAYDEDGYLTNAGEMNLLRDELNGRLAKTSLGVVTDTLVYNGFGEVADYKALAGTDTVFRCSYSRDKLGRIIEKRETIQGLTHRYQYAYDLAGRLTDVLIDSAAYASYAYDSNSNRITKTHGVSVDSGTYDDQDRILRYSGTEYAYNNNGDLQKEISGSDTTRYHYDSFGNLVSAKLLTGDSIAYIIDGQNRLVGKKINGHFTQGFIYMNQLNPIAEVDSAGNVLERFVYGAKRNIPDQIIVNDTIFRIVSDHLGSPRLVINTVTGSIVQRIDYDEFGDVLYDSNPGFQPFGFGGGIYDRNTDLLRFGRRDYSSNLGRWTTKDPIDFAGGSVNLYTYVGNNPVNFTDPSGLKVYLCSRPADLPWPASLFDHYWIKTDTYEAGLGATPGKIPGQGSPDLPFTPTQTVDHTGQSNEPGSKCTEVPDVNESCVDNKIKPGQPEGSWMPLNTCEDFTMRSLMGCRDGL